MEINKRQVIGEPKPPASSATHGSPVPFEDYSSITFKGKEIETVTYKGKEISEITYKGKVIALVKDTTIKNTYTGTLKPELIPKFESYINDIPDNAFYYEGKITGITLPEVKSIGEHAFHWAPLTSINAPKSLTIGGNAFYHIINDASTSVTLPYVFNSDNQKNRIFGSGHWSNITFHWTKIDGSAYTGRNDFEGDFTSISRMSAFFGITTTVNENEFGNETLLTSITLPKVTTIKGGAFKWSPLRYIEIPLATTIESGNIVTSHPFNHIVNDASTTVIMQSKFNTNAEKDRIFGSGNWSKVHFIWV